MAFWIAVALLTLLATALIVLPLVRAPRGGAVAFDHDRAIYRARLREIDSDLKLGRIDEAEADAAKAEEGRKLIALSASADKDKAQGSPRNVRAALIMTVLFVPLAAIAFYVIEGVPGMPDMAIASRTDRDLSTQTITQLLERAEAQLAKNPNDVRGWRVVAPVYMRLGRFDDAVTAWRNAARLDPSSVDLKTSLGEAMTAAAGGVVTEDARHLFDDALKARAGDAKARFYIAIALGQQGADEEALKAWNALIADAPANAPWLEVANAQRKAVADRLGQDVSEVAPKVAQGGAQAPGPSQEDIASASQLSAQDRQSMIETMVAGLAEKLKANPDDKPGWQRLVRSYTVLGDADKARQALEDARKAFPDDAEFLAQLEAMDGQPPAPGPSQEDIAAASQLSAQDRQSMIETMVAGLAEKLKANPNDKSGWQRLVRSYTVLGHADKAKKAVENARTAFPDDAEFLAQLQSIIDQIPVLGGTPKGSE